MASSKKWCVELGERRRYFDCKAAFRRRMPEAPGPNDDGSPLLPPATASGKPTLVMDLDETLVYIKCAQGCLISCGCGGRTDVDYEYYIAKRPGVEAFLASMAELYELVLWTAAPQAYGDGALRLLDPHSSIISHRLYQQHLVRGRKSLSMLGRDLSRLVMVDDSCSNFSSQDMANVIVIQRYIADGTMENDDKLQLLGKLLTRLASKDDDLREGLKQEQGAAEVIKGSGATGAAAWCPSWRRKTTSDSNSGGMISVRVEMPVYVPPPVAAAEGDEALFGVSVSA